MILNERLLTYMNSLESGNTDYLNKIEKKALEDFVPVIRKDTQQFLKLLLSVKKPKRILEIGTAVGFSALLMAEYNPIACEIVTIENYAKRIPIARANFKEAGRESQITLLEGDAQALLPSLEGSFDFIFMDAAKGQYIYFLPELVRLLKAEGILVTDNVLQDVEIRKRQRGKADETSRIADSGKQLRGFENCGCIRSGCGIYWRRSIFSSCQSEKFFHRRNERGNCICP